jgi:phytoene dehydrogenase-like protein
VVAARPALGGRVSPPRAYDAVVVGAGPNGLAAAVTLAGEGRSVLVLEAEPEWGGGTRTSELTLPGFHHDVCSAVHPLGVGSPFFARQPLADHGLTWAHPTACLAHPFDDGSAAVLFRSAVDTARTLGADGGAWRRLLEPFAERWDDLARDALGPLRPPRHPALLARFGFFALRSARGLVEDVFEGRRARALFAGIAAHVMMPLDRPPTAAFGLVLAACAHARGWPVARGGSRRIADALVARLRALGGEVVTSAPVRHLSDLPRSRAVLFDVTPRQLLGIAGRDLPGGYRRRLTRYRYGAAAYKVDYALDGPIPWASPACRQAGTVHLGPTLDDIADAEARVARGEHPERPYVIVAQQSLADPSRAPPGKHNGSTFPMAARLEAQIERFAPGFRERVLARAITGPAALERHNANYIGGDINGGVQDLAQLFTRPVLAASPYATPNPRLFLCSSSTPPGGGVHGLCGYFAARTALRRGL